MLSCGFGVTRPSRVSITYGSSVGRLGRRLLKWDALGGLRVRERGGGGSSGGPTETSGNRLIPAELRENHHSFPVRSSACRIFQRAESTLRKICVISRRSKQALLLYSQGLPESENIALLCIS